MSETVHYGGGERPKRSVWQAMLRGFCGHCPNCGEGKLFRAYLKVADECPKCGEALHHQRADDAPAYFVIVIVGHIIVPMALSLEIAMSPPYWLHLLLWLPATVIFSLALLPAVKGAIVALQWANYMHGFEHEPPRPALAASSAEAKA